MLHGIQACVVKETVCPAEAKVEAAKKAPAAHALEYRFGSRQPLGFSVKSESNIASVTGPVGELSLLCEVIL